MTSKALKILDFPFSRDENAMEKNRIVLQNPEILEMFRAESQRPEQTSMTNISDNVFYQFRSELEINYSKGLQKIAGKLLKVSKEMCDK